MKRKYFIGILILLGILVIVGFRMFLSHRTLLFRPCVQFSQNNKSFGCGFFAQYNGDFKEQGYVNEENLVVGRFGGVKEINEKEGYVKVLVSFPRANTTINQNFIFQLEDGNVRLEKKNNYELTEPGFELIKVKSSDIERNIKYGQEVLLWVSAPTITDENLFKNDPNYNRAISSWSYRCSKESSNFIYSLQLSKTPPKSTDSCLPTISQILFL